MYTQLLATVFETHFKVYVGFLKANDDSDSNMNYTSLDNNDK
jgi:hypothetical protein